MVQIRTFLDGETHYSKITGPTGPLVYPALHVYIYTILYYLTDHGTNILRGQVIFAGLYLATLAMVLACYRRVGAPPWLLVPLALSKRLHSIFLLRLFNDAWAAFFLWASIYLLQRRNFEAGAWIWGLGLGTKMTLLLSAPAVAMVVVQGAGTANAWYAGCIVFMSQIAMAMPFLDREVGFEYFGCAFDFGRQFLFKWTVNWRFVGEETFSSRGFAISLLVIHVSLLLVFLQTKWIRPTSTSIWEFVRMNTRTMPEDVESSMSKKVTPTFVMDTMLSSVVIGLLCARSLHYQFYAYLGWATPYLLWRTGAGPLWVLVNWAVQEYCWLVYPSSHWSSAIVVLILAIQVLGSLTAPSPPVDHISPAASAIQEKEGHPR